ncbi:hypothetical protein [Bradyrhizobium sp. USDA 4452]
MRSSTLLCPCTKNKCFTVDIGKHLRGGLTAEDLDTLTRVLESMYAFVDVWFDGGYVGKDLPSEDALQDLLRNSLRSRGLKVAEATRVGGGKLDLHVEEAVVIENKFHDTTDRPRAVMPAAGMQGRRYAISLGSQLVMVVMGYEVASGGLPNKSQTLSIHGISGQDANRVELRFSLPYGAPYPSNEQADPSTRS